MDEAGGQKRLRVLKRVQEIVKTIPELNEAKVTVYGSTAQGLCLPSSDIDITVIKDINKREMA